MEVAFNFREEIKKYFADRPIGNEDIEEECKLIIEEIHTVTKEVIGCKETHKKKEWFDEDC